MRPKIERWHLSVFLRALSTIADGFKRAFTGAADQMDNRDRQEVERKKEAGQ